jgi:SAM-dependent methyltransferase
MRALTHLDCAGVPIARWKGVDMKPSGSGKGVDLYGASYRSFATDLYSDIRREAFGQDIGQTGWLTAEEQDLFLGWLELSRPSQLLDLACGSGKPTLRIAQKTGCHVSGVDLHSEAIVSAKANARELGYEGRTKFYQGNAAERLSFADASFDAVTCIDAINHLPDRPAVLQEWHRVLKPGGFLLFTDPIVLTGPMTNAEMAIRTSIGHFVFVPAGYDEVLLKRSGFEVERVEDRTQNMATNAAGWLEARSRRETDLRKIEGDDVFFGQQRFLETAAILAKERRLSRFALLARK